MTTITLTLESIEPELAQSLRQRAVKNGRTLEAKITAILVSVLTSEKAKQAAAEDTEIDLATAIRRRFVSLGGFDISEIPREPIRTAPFR